MFPAASALALLALGRSKLTGFQWVMLLIGTACVIGTAFASKPHADACAKIASDSSSAGGYLLGLLFCVLSVAGATSSFVYTSVLGTTAKLTPLEATMYLSLPAAVIMVPVTLIADRKYEWDVTTVATCGKLVVDEITMNDWQVFFKALSFETAGLTVLSGVCAFLFNFLTWSMVIFLSPIYTALAGNFAKGTLMLVGVLSEISGGVEGLSFTLLVRLLLVIGIILTFTGYAISEALAKMGAGGRRRAAGSGCCGRDGASRGSLCAVAAVGWVLAAVFSMTTGFLLTDRGQDSPWTAPYLQVTGLSGHQQPVRYGSVSEKTIWSYWWHPTNCPNSKQCVLPPFVQMCVDSIIKNKGSFDFKLMHFDEVHMYVNGVELPFGWKHQSPATQKDALMNALLARYGGVAMDVSTILLKPFDDSWNQMVAQNAIFRGYMYRLNGQPWGHAETTAVWCMMARREGIFRTATVMGVIGMGDAWNAGLYHPGIPYFAMGDQTVTPVLGIYNFSLPHCHEDATVSQKSDCPEFQLPVWDEALVSPRGDSLLLEDPRDGPQLPFAFGDEFGMALWNRTEDTKRDYLWPCQTPKQCWELFLGRYNASKAPFVKFFHSGGDAVRGQTRDQLLGNPDSFLCGWLELAHGETVCR